MFLITTKNIRPINKKDKIIYLGNWCISDKKSLIRNPEDHQIMSHYYDSYKKQYDDFIYINNIYEIILDELTKTLNELHSKKWNKRQWRILLGPWLHKFLEISLDRWRLIEKAEKTYKIRETVISDLTLSDIYTSSYSDLSEKCKLDNWNQKIFDIIILIRNKIPYSIRKNSQKKKQKVFKKNFRYQSSLREKFKLILKRFIFNLGPKPSIASKPEENISLDLLFL